eukprot:XP_013993547.1 PREDICTED: gem-associated protein 5-like [Salmo salar]
MARQQPGDPVLKGLYTTWATVLEKDGHLTTATKCFDAAKVITKKNDPVSLKMPASLAKISGESDLSHSLHLRGAKDLYLRCGVLTGLAGSTATPHRTGEHIGPSVTLLHYRAAHCESNRDRRSDLELFLQPSLVCFHPWSASGSQEAKMASWLP